MLTWGNSARSRFQRLRQALTTKSGNRTYFRKISQDAGQLYVSSPTAPTFKMLKADYSWYTALHLGQVPVDSQTGSLSDTSSDYDVPS